MKCAVLGITGSIAAYKACDIISALKKANIDVRVILTDAGAKFITPLALESIAHTPVVTDMFSRERPWEVEHIALAKRADVFLVAPASANFLGKAACGIADDMLTTTILATKAPVLVAPAMNTNMYLHPQVQANIQALKARGYRMIEPANGMLACGDVGIGRLAEVDCIVEAALQALQIKQDLVGKRILVSAGPTQERIDPVRYITNRSSGKMGYALAEAAMERGAAVTLVSGPTNLQTPAGVTRIDVQSSEDMYNELTARFADCDAVLMAAAPADFTPESVATQKIKKDGESLSLLLKPTKDILASLGKLKKQQRLLGFAAETQSLEENAQIKLKKKNLDMIAANDVTAEGVGFNVETNAVTVYKADGSKEQSGLMTKRALADWLLDRLFSGV
ncbi:MAG: bifunctional phosphopantothenoylcysteine decarboxylase/phosphopantothenate--cysteine ligase CoaBC [Eubacteriales bacterium]|nr:bifunctional phosphopantothenoylcysteine decarboxylase/phosphopantothenate--cysteine ligase CoaBC [Eubacteriales bacterium]